MPSTDLYSRIKAAVVATIQGLELENVQVYSQIDLENDQLNIQCPAIVCITAGLTEELLPGDTEHREYDWPVGVMIVNREAKQSVEKEATYLSWRKQITDAFNQRRLSGVPEVYGGKVFPRVIFDNRLPQYQTVRSSLLLRFGCWETR